MNANSIWAGEYYAFSDYRPNKTFLMNAKKGKAIKVIKEKSMFAERATMLVEMEVETPYTTYITKVRARDVIDFWDSYEKEREHIRAEREEQHRIAKEMEERLRAEREQKFELQREADEAARRNAEERKTALVAMLLDRTGMPEELVYSVGPSHITLDRTGVELWLSLAP